LSFLGDDRGWFLFLLFSFVPARDGLSTSSTSISSLNRQGENRGEEEEVDKNSSSLISIGGFILGLVAFTISYLVAYSL